MGWLRFPALKRRAIQISPFQGGPTPVSSHSTGRLLPGRDAGACWNLVRYGSHADNSPPSGRSDDSAGGFMSRTLRESFLRSDLAAVAALLSSIPDDDAHVLDRIGIQSRIEQAQEELRILLLSEKREVAFAQSELATAAERASARRTEIEDEPVQGTFLGVLLDSRRFEHRVSKSGEVLRGRLAEDVDPRSLLQWTDRDCIAHLQVVTLARGPREQRRYTLLRLTES